MSELEPVALGRPTLVKDTIASGDVLRFQIAQFLRMPVALGRPTLVKDTIASGDVDCSVGQSLCPPSCSSLL